MLTLSILICSLLIRSRQLDELLIALAPQISNRPIEVLVEKDDGKISIGTKRNRLMARAAGKYLCYIDDDDMVSQSYVELILGGIEKHFEEKKFYPDCVGIVGIIRGGKHNRWQFRHSITVTNWCEDKKNHLFFRTPNHLNPILSKHAKSCCFPEKNWGEDRSYSDNVRKYLNTETFIEEPIYHYRFGNK